MTGGTTGDEARWAEALSILGDEPSPEAEDRLCRARRTRIVLVVAGAVLVAALAAVVGLLFLDVGEGGGPGDRDVPAWAGAVGGSLWILGGLLTIVGGVSFARSMRRTRAWRRSLDVLTFRQRRELVHQVRGRRPLVSEHTPLVRAQAEFLIDQRGPLLVMAGAAVNFVGINVRDPEPWRLVVGGLGAVLGIGAFGFQRREAARARRFLEQHPPAEAAP